VPSALRHGTHRDRWFVLQTYAVSRYPNPVSPDSEPTVHQGDGWREDGPRRCSLANALEVVGERYSMLIVRELGYGVTRFNDIRHNTGAPRDTLVKRLRKLEQAGVITRRRYSEHPPRDEYLLTDAGVALQPALRRMRKWGKRFAAPPNR
jgi:DNA-binding HxlR family transcriptional regulator